MNALILKDCYVLWKQLKIFLIIILVLSAFNSAFNSVFATLYAAMLPYTAMAYDERSKWDQLAAMMPYSTRDIVLSKYLLGMLCTAAAAILSLLVQAVAAPLLHTAFQPQTTLFSFFAALCILAAILPVMFWLGVEKGRVTMFILIFLVCGTSGAMASLSTSGVFQGLPRLLVVLLPAAAVVLNGISIPLSIRLYQRQRR